MAWDQEAGWPYAAVSVCPSGRSGKFIGDAVMALFGAPVAHEDDLERGGAAALAIRDWVRDEEQIPVGWR